MAAFIGLVAVPFVARLGVPQEGAPSLDRGRRIRGLMLITILVVSSLTFGILSSRSAASDAQDADRRAKELETSIVDAANADRTLFFATAFSVNGSIAVPTQIDKADIGDNRTTTYSQVQVGRVFRCVIVHVDAFSPPQSEVLNRRC